MRVELKLGDCLDKFKEIPDGSVDLILTDPPYGTTACKWDTVIPFGPMWEQIWRVLKSNGACVLFSANPFSAVLISSQLSYFKYEWIWQKEAGTGFLNAKRRPLPDHEQCLVFYRKQPTYIPQMDTGKPYKTKKGGLTDNYRPDSKAEVITENCGERYPKSVRRFDRDRSKVHPTQKPVALLEYLVKTYTNEGETVLDFTMGSGSTGVACVNANRAFIGIEKNEKYFKIAENRINAAIALMNNDESGAVI